VSSRFAARLSRGLDPWLRLRQPSRWEQARSWITARDVRLGGLVAAPTETENIVQPNEYAMIVCVAIGAPVERDRRRRCCYAAFRRRRDRS
jgi:hypothetical protein